MSFKVIGDRIEFEGYHVATLVKGINPTIEDRAVARLKGLPCVESARRALEQAQKDFEERKRKHFHGK